MCFIKCSLFFLRGKENKCSVSDMNNNARIIIETREGRWQMTGYWESNDIWSVLRASVISGNYPKLSRSEGSLAKSCRSSDFGGQSRHLYGQCISPLTLSTQTFILPAFPSQISENKAQNGFQLKSNLQTIYHSAIFHFLTDSIKEIQNITKCFR